MSTSLPFSPDDTLDELLHKAEERYTLRFEPISAGGQTIEVLQIANMAEYVEKITEAENIDDLELPFWAKIWPASMILAHFLSSMPHNPDIEILEIGAGLGVCGLFAAARGFKTTITDITPDALLFARINALKNGLQDRVDIRPADFSADKLGRRFDYIIGSEILYVEKLHRGLSKFLLNHIKPTRHAEILLSRSYSRKSIRFFKLMDKEFLSQEKVVGGKRHDTGSDQEKFLCSIHRFKPRKQVA